MKKILFIIVPLVTFGFLATQHFSPDVATHFLRSLNDEQRKKVQLPFNDSSKNNWHYFPATMWPREGLQLQELNPSQKELFFKFLGNYLSESGYTKARKVLNLENVLAEIEGNSRTRDPEKYHITIYGNPGKDRLWAWSFEGHHLSLNFTISNRTVSMAPMFFGANPAIIKEGKKKGEKTLGNEEDIAFKLINLLTSKQKVIALIQIKAFVDIVTSNSSKVDPLEPVGIRMKDLTSDQQAILLDLINDYLSNMPPELATKRMDNLKKEELNEIRFGWAGATQPGEPHYYRVQGKTFLIELDNTQDYANHIHSVWRDFDGDFGRDLIREHYQNSEHHHD